MNDLLMAYTITLAFVCVIIGLLVLYRLLIANKYLEAERKLRLKLNEATSYFKDGSGKAPSFVQNAIGDIGISGIIEELGIDPGILKNPLVKGLIDKYAPRLIESLSKQQKGEQGTNVQEGF